MELLKTSYISKDFGEKKIIENVSITLGHQEIVSLLGVSGVGKTTLFHIISGQCFSFRPRHHWETGIC